ncbi:MAG: PHP domain-containing protein [Candidatus Staskawiczbacteria bacterium]|jgi:histidinol phosphatase-like PHP family hydrolase
MKPKFKRFNDLTPQDINFDFHIHTNQTDGFCSPEEIIDRAISLKLKAIAITEHVNKNSDWFDNFKEKMDSLKKNKNIKIFFGIEAKIINFKGEIDANYNMIANSDIIIGVVHRYPIIGGEGFLSVEQIGNLGPQKAAAAEFKLLMALLNNKNIHVLGHPFGIYSKIFGGPSEDYLERLLIESLKNKIAVEINTKYMVGRELFFKLLKKNNPYVSIGSDAHHKEEIARSFDIIREETKR